MAIKTANTKLEVGYFYWVMIFKAHYCEILWRIYELSVIITTAWWLGSLTEHEFDSYRFNYVCNPLGSSFDFDVTKDVSNEQILKHPSGDYTLWYTHKGRMWSSFPLNMIHKTTSKRVTPAESRTNDRWVGGQ